VVLANDSKLVKARIRRRVTARFRGCSSKLKGGVYIAGGTKSNRESGKGN